MKDARGQAKKEREWLAREQSQRCQVCGRKFVLRAEKVCSRDCAAKLAQHSESDDRR
jgi:predicted nucleic acid-binding Zn ribbon protein